jgi:hypothetical protein
VLVGVPAVVGLPLAIVTCVLASRDLDRMGGGRLDSRGQAQTWRAWERARQAITLSLLGPFACLVLCCGCLSVLDQL